MNSQAHTGDRFIHPYNFVSLPERGLGAASEVEPFKRGPAAGHDRYDPQRFSGHLDCVLTTKTPWFIPDPRKRRRDEQREHDTLGYFTLDDVKEWKPDEPQADETRPAIPAASLRGMVRSVFEAATLSCFSVFDEGGLDFRIGFDPATERGDTQVPLGRRSPEYLPVRVVERRKGWPARAATA
ncbi:MAG: hypothetical protein K6T30_03820 [Alicyclobacillus sp.]|nr:hypothetical protein [Alicyclobacillus sp.]